MAFYSMAFLCFIVIFVCLHEIAGNFFPKYQWVVRLIAGVSFFFLISGYKILFLLISAFTVWGGAIYKQKLPKEFRTHKRGKEVIEKEMPANTENIYFFHYCY